MKEFLFVFRNDYKGRPDHDSPEELQAVMKEWMDWMGGIAAQNKLADRGNPLTGAGKVVRPNNVVTDGPYTEIKEVIGGYIIVKAASLDEAAELAHGCPIFKTGGNVEVREVSAM
ncbi:MAG: YciI family protein [Bacteroidota bacterium]